MTTKLIIQKLHKAIKSKNEDNIKLTEDILAETITEASNEPYFYSLPIDQLSEVINKVDFSNDDEIKEPIQLLQTLIRKTSEYHDKESVLLLSTIKVENLPSLSIDDIICLISNFTGSELLIKLSELYYEEKSLLRPDYSHTISELTNEIHNLKQEIERKNKENEYLRTNHQTFTEYHHPHPESGTIITTTPAKETAKEEEESPTKQTKTITQTKSNSNSKAAPNKAYATILKLGLLI